MAVWCWFQIYTWYRFLVSGEINFEIKLRPYLTWEMPGKGTCQNWSGIIRLYTILCNIYNTYGMKMKIRESIVIIAHVRFKTAISIQDNRYKYRPHRIITFISKFYAQLTSLLKWFISECKICEIRQSIHRELTSANLFDNIWRKDETKTSTYKSILSVIKSW